jgi:arylsulfatase A-like enzyme
MGEHGMWFHDQSVQEELIHIPLIVRFPGDRWAGRRVGTPVSLVDLGPTIFEFAIGASMERLSSGISLLPLIERDQPEVDRMRVVSVRHNVKKYSRENRERRGDLNVVVRHGRWKGVLNADIGVFELYDLERDPGERHEMAGKHRGRAKRMRDFAASWLRRNRDCSSAGRGITGR